MHARIGDSASLTLGVKNDTLPHPWLEAWLMISQGPSRGSRGGVLFLRKCFANPFSDFLELVSIISRVSHVLYYKSSMTKTHNIQHTSTQHNIHTQTYTQHSATTTTQTQAPPTSIPTRKTLLIHFTT